jgi:TolB-like protein/Tfp pilus assembly protein PilF
VAVLPFENVGGDSLEEYFADGMTDELATALGRVPGLSVTARSAAYQYKGRRDLDHRAVGEALGVRYLLMGSVRRAASQVRISAWLTRVTDGVEVWSDSYNPAAGNLLAAQDSLTSTIADTLAVQLGALAPRRGAALVRRGTTDPVAYDLYLKGMYHFNRRRPALEGAAGYFEDAIAHDPGFARAYAGLANALALGSYFADARIPERRVIDAATRALSLDSTLADAHVASGIMHLAVGRYDAGEEALRRAIALDGANAAAYFQLGRLLIYRGRLAEATVELERAKSLEPYHAHTSAWLGYAMIWTATRERALAEATRAWELDSSSALVRAVSVLTALETGRPDEALRIARWSVPDGFNLGTFAWVLAVAGAPDEAGAVVRQIETLGADAWMAPMNLAFAMLGLGDTARALDLMERSIERGEPIGGFWAFWSTMFAPVRESDRFAALARRLGLDSLALAGPEPR